MVKEIKIMFLRRFSLIGALVILGLTCPQLTNESVAQPFWQNPNSNCNFVGGGRLLEQLNLTESQRAEISAIQAKYASSIQANHQDLNNAYQELRSMMINNTSEQVIRSKYQDIMNMRQQNADLRFESMLEVRNVLTFEQRQELADLMDQRRAHHGGGMRDPGLMLP
jgi:protein CpxP